MIKKFSLNRRGVTLVELLVVVLLMGLVATAMFSVYSDTGRSSRTEEDVVELQQVLRTAIDQIAADIRMAGFVVGADVAPFAAARPENTSGNPVDPFPPGAPPTTDVTHLIMRTASAQATAIRVETAPTWDGTSLIFSDLPADALQLFSDDNIVRVVRSATADQPVQAKYKVTISTAGGLPDKMILTPDYIVPGQPPVGSVSYQRGDMIVRSFATKVNSSVTDAQNQATVPYPEFVAYATTSVNSMPADPALSLDAAVSIVKHVGACVPPGLCAPWNGGCYAASGVSSMQIGTQTPLNNDTNIPRVTRLTFSYIMRDGSEQSSVTDSNRGTTANSLLRNIAAVRVTIAGQTPSGKRRELSTVVRLMNRGYEAIKE